MMVDTAFVSVVVVYPIIIPTNRWKSSTTIAAAAVSKYDTSNTYSL